MMDKKNLMEDVASATSDEYGDTPPPYTTTDQLLLSKGILLINVVMQ